MKILCTALLVFFISFQVQAQSEGGDAVPVNNTNKGKVDTNDLATKIMNKINACSDVACFVTFYNSMAKVCSGFSNEQSGKKIIAEILKLMDKKQDGVLFDIYMSKSNNHQKYFLKCAKLLPTDLQTELSRKAREYLNRNN
ncbi:hypothetical protein [Polaribacter septentrionalilitoris]|mgnify:FL=1|uniref:hypothetical protein n=1 Tax=Polaribacter septentrionalilitoris TaxID=2494657 RepID=UPI001358651D|nr:hypothetical protein [Polaribacter septentrionalilitoris]